jgi:lysophospholipase L1-like esterase
VAFGDSITEGKVADTTLLPNGGYPGYLQASLAARYLTQTIAIAHEGCGGETAAAGPAGTLPPCLGGVVRLPGVLSADAPQVLLLLEGVNDLFDGNASDIPPMIDGLRTMLREARSLNVQVCLGTLTPERSNTPHGHAFLIIPSANDQIRQLALQEGAVLVDLYNAFGGSADPYIGTDGLHPNASGYQKIAETFFDSIRANFEITQGGQDRLHVGLSSPVRSRR